MKYYQKKKKDYTVFDIRNGL